VLYKKVGESGVFSLFERKKSSNYFIAGTGEILSQDESQIKLRLKTSSATIKFSYFPFLKVKNCKIIKANESFPPLSLIDLEECSTNNEIVIESINPISRMLN
jgi:hypothetical protein